MTDTTLSLAAKSGLAVNETSHDIYIADTGNHRIVEFSASGGFIRAFGADVGGVGVNVCTTSCQAGTPGTSPGSFESPTFLAIDNSGGASNGDLYVADSATNVVSKFEADGTLVSDWGAGGQFDGSSAPGGPFAELAGLAIGSGGDLAVFEVEPHRLFSFEEDASFAAEIETPRGSAARGLGLDGEGNFFKVNGDLTIQKFAPSGASIGQISENAAGQVTGLSADTASGVLYADFGATINAYAFNGAGEVINPGGSCIPLEFEPGCPPTERFGGGSLTEGGALAVDASSDTVYAVDVGASSIAVFAAVTLPDVTTGTAEVHSTTSVTLKGEVNPNGIPLDECFFEYGETSAYGVTVPCEEPDAEEIGTGNSFVPVHADLINLSPGATYHYRLVAANSNGSNEESGDREFSTGPSIVSTFVSKVSATAATLNTEINPNGTSTTYRFQYVADSAFQLSGYATAVEVPVGGEAIGSGTSPIFRSLQLLGLTPSTTYHFRVLAENALGTVESPDRTFATQFGGLGFELADDRVWELVSPPDKHGARLVGGGETHLQASAEGSGLAYQGKLPISADPEGNRTPERVMNLARRNADGSWTSQTIASPNDGVSGVAPGNGTEFKLFNADLSEALVEPRTDTPLSPEASELTPYLRKNANPPEFTPLVTGKEPFANVPPSIKFGGEGLVPGVSVVGVSPGFHRFALLSEESLVEGASVSGPTLYEWSNGQIKPVSVLPANEGGELVEGRQVGSGRGSVHGAVSEDGSRVFWSSGGFPELGGLYVRDTEAEESVRLDVVQGGGGGGPTRPIFQGASADGTVVFFTDSHQLTEDASLEGSDLYRCEIPPESTAAGCSTLTDLSVSIEAGESARVEGTTPGMTSDGQALYFVARGVLDNVPNPAGDSAVAGQANLYLWQQGRGVRFVATLGSEDSADWGKLSTTLEGEASRLSATASPSGRYLAFMSQRSLTGYDNRDADTGELTQELFRYDAAADQLECVSCNPTGMRPHSVTATVTESLVNPLGQWAGQQVAAALPPPISLGLFGVSVYRPRAVLDNGRVFFNADDSLVPADSNGQWDVYQYEPIGVGSCAASSGGTSITRSAGGCVSLISSGTAEEEAAFFDASVTGNDAFFFTPARLSALDEDSELDIYDARVGGIAATRPVNTECLGEACQPLTQPPSDSTPASAVFKGSGNLHPAKHKHCRKGKRKVRQHGRVRCVAKKHHLGHNGKHRKAASGRRVAR